MICFVSFLKRFDLGCELSFNHQRSHVWGDEAKKVEIHGFWDTYFSKDASILELQGEVLRIGQMPVAWASPDAVANFRRLRLRSVQYHPEVKRLALDAIKYIVDDSNTLPSLTPASFTCVHLRRGDFLSAGWLGNEVGNLTKVAAFLQGVLTSSERLYIATDETDLNVLKPLTDLGAVLWRDVVGALSPSKDTLLQFGDYVGLVEQTICAHSKTFIGSKCSSFTGGIYNIRAEILSDYSQNSITGLVQDILE
jgi:hypothetical protein